MDADALMQMVEGEVITNNYLVILRAMKMAENWQLPCSYRDHLGRYVCLKLSERRARERYERTNISRIQYETSHVRRLLYRHPCKQCATCKGRRKPWPSNH